MAEFLQAGGWKVAGCDIVLPEEQPSFYFLQCDVRLPAEVAAAVERVVSRFGRLDALVNNAGVGGFTDFFELSPERFDDVIAINLRGYFLMAQAAARVMRDGGHRGSIVQIASTRAVQSEPGSEAYAASKGGIVALTHAMALSLAPHRIRVNCISPGWINTGGEELRPIDHRQHPAERVGQAEDIARACAYFLDPENDFVTGSHLIVDGGMTRKMIYEE